MERYWYKVTLTPAQEGGLVVQCIEVRGAISEGDTKQEALDDIADAIARILEVRLKEAKDQARKSHGSIQVVEVDA